MKTCFTFDHALKLAILAVAAAPASLSAQITLSQEVDANTFVSSGQPNMNFDNLGAMEIAAPTRAQNRTEETLLGFETAAIESGFNADYGAGNWVITSVTLKLFSNVANAGTQPPSSSFNKIAAGEFELDWLSDNSWNPAQITYNNISSVLPGTGGNTLASLGDFDWLANGASSTTWAFDLNPNLVNEIASGGDVSIFGQPTAGSTVGYLFNTPLLNGAELNVTASAVPEPLSTAPTLALMVFSLAGLAALRRSQHHGETTM